MREPVAASEPGLTVRDVACRYRVGEDKVRGWIARGELRAINTAKVLCGAAVGDPGRRACGVRARSCRRASAEAATAATTP